MQTRSPPLVPYIGLFLKDLVFIEDGNNDNTDGLINFQKRIMIAKVISDIRKFQRRLYKYQQVPELINHLIYFPDWLPDAESYDLSLRIEPRDPFAVIEELLLEEQTYVILYY